MRIPMTLVATLALLATACSGSDLEVLDGAGELGAASQPIINGNPPDQPYHGAVVSLHELSRGGNQVYVLPFCSGTLVTDTVVVTAAHCLDVSKKAWEYKTIGADKLAVYVGDDPSADIVDHLYSVTEAEIYASYDPQGLTGDIGLLRLSSAVTEADAATVPNLPASLGFTADDIGLPLNFAGFGDDENGDYGVKLQADGVLGGLGCTVPGCYGADDPATQISYSQYQAGPCFGDSGGPAFLARNGTFYVAGVTSWGDNNCTQFGVSTRVDAFESFIDDFIGGAPEPPDCSADGTCNPECAEGEDPDCVTPPDDCGDGVCGAGESCDGRDGTLECAADCPGKTNGKPSGRYCYVEGVCEGLGCP